MFKFSNFQFTYNQISGFSFIAYHLSKINLCFHYIKGLPG